MAYVSKEITKFLRDCDKDGDNRVTQAEVLAYYNSKDPKSAQKLTNQLFKKYDKDRSGDLNIDEITKYAKGLLTREISKVLKQFDTNKDKKITYAELISNCEDGELVALMTFGDLNKNNDDVVTVDEIRAYLNSHGSGPQQ
ncbi:hypothetical protein CYY_000169 [Polysphondylium violaceum]|uniref:EF-hand domain-containing protein n=1 Tax=Polysphondylium violaceum TaxID=133409 RepID=A0A8J4Q3E1_9MYCE|nr:hypothetical protein CYY_000169 [Polysphondylium violaceum]